jgi:hypothetical protein
MVLMCRKLEMMCNYLEDEAERKITEQETVLWHAYDHDLTRKKDAQRCP